MTHCPLCGAEGETGFVSFACVRSTCGNFDRAVRNRWVDAQIIKMRSTGAFFGVDRSDGSPYDFNPYITLVPKASP